jgi:hypothetical protein
MQHWMGMRPVCVQLACNFKRQGKVFGPTAINGLWYAMIKTHMVFPPPRPAHQEISGSNARTSTSMKIRKIYTLTLTTTGLIESDHHPRTFGPELNLYFNGIGAVMGSYGSHHNREYRINSHYWSRNDKDSRAGLGFQMTYGTTRM